MRHTLQREIRKSYWAYNTLKTSSTTQLTQTMADKQPRKNSGHTLNIFAKILPASLLFVAMVRPSVRHHAKQKYLIINSPQFSRKKHLAPFLTKGPIPTPLCQMEARGRVVSALDCEAEGRWFESHSGQWLENSLCSPSS